MEFHVADIFESVVTTVGERAAIIRGGTTLSYDQLNAKANAFANYLQSLDIQPGESVGLMMSNEPDYLVMLLGCFKIRAVPINLDNAAHLDEITHVCKVTKLRHLFYSPEDGELPKAMSSERVELRPMTESLIATIASGSSNQNFEPRSGSDHYVLFTGGTTGRPSGVIWRHEDAFFAAMGGGNWSGPPVASPEEVATNIVGRTTRVFVCSPLRHASAQWVAFAALFAGATLVLSDSRGFDAELALDEIDRHEVTLLSIVGDGFAKPLLDLLDGTPQRWSLASLNGIFSGGAVLSKRVANSILAHVPTLVIVDSYGSTETGGQGRWVLVAGNDAAELQPPRFLMDANTAVLDENREIIPMGSEGTGRIARSGRVPIGFLTSCKRRPSDLFERDGVNWVISHDIGRVTASGSIELLGRDGTALKSGGKLVLPEEVEATLRLHDHVVDAVVAGSPDEVFGDRITAIVQCQPKVKVTEAELDEFCRSHLASYKIPREIIWVEQIKRNHLGKINRAWARDLVGAPPHLQA